PHRYGEHSRRIVKGNSKLKMNGTFETPWDTAVRAISEQLEYRNDESNGEWCSFDINEYKKEWKCCTYLEWTFEGNHREEYTRLAGVFVVQLMETPKFRIKNYEKFHVLEIKSTFAIQHTK
ncbi:unnamed protein product, partial [Rotaria sp. Silwood2]